MDWVDPISSEPAEEREDDMSNIAVGFATWMHFQAKQSPQAGADFTTSSRVLCEP